MHVVRRDQRDAKFARERDQLLVERFEQVFQAIVALELDIVVVAKELEIFFQFGFGSLDVALLQELRDLALGAAAGRDQALVVLLQCLPVDPRFVVKALEVGDRSQFEEIVVTGQIFG